VIGVLLAALFVFVALALNGAVSLDPQVIARSATYVIVGAVALFFLHLFVFGELTTDEKKRTLVIIVLFCAAARFWSGFEQWGPSRNIFAFAHTDRSFPGGLCPAGVHPAGFYPSLNAMFIIAVAPLYAWFWVALARRMMEPSLPIKFGLGLI